MGRMDEHSSINKLNIKKEPALLGLVFTAMAYFDVPVTKYNNFFSVLERRKNKIEF